MCNKIVEVYGQATSSGLLFLCGWVGEVPDKVIKQNSRSMSDYWGFLWEHTCHKFTFVNRHKSMSIFVSETLINIVTYVHVFLC